MNFFGITMDRHPNVSSSIKWNRRALRIASTSRLRFLYTLAGLGLPLITGCVVGQRPGKGEVHHLREPTMGASYWLYLPEGYAGHGSSGFPSGGYPMVMTFHGMKPFDDEHRQIREWQQEADRYGFIVCAPSLSVSALSSPLPLNNPENARLQRDEKASLAIMDDVIRVARVNPSKVLATSWSYGGYVAHYMMNRHPERFRCLAVKQSNFNSNLLDPNNVRRYQDRKIGIFYTENDFAICRRESHEAAEWYAQNGFDLTFAVFEKKGHERTPGVAAEFFARVVGAEPKTPPVELARMQVISQPEAEPSASAPAGEFAPSANERVARKRTDETESPDSPSVNNPTPTPPSEFETQFVTPAKKQISGPLRVRLDPPSGEAPLLVSFSTIMPDTMRAGATALWTTNGEPIANGMQGKKLLNTVGTHRLEVVVSTRSGKEYRAWNTVTVLPKTRTRR